MQLYIVLYFFIFIASFDLLSSAFAYRYVDTTHVYGFYRRNALLSVCCSIRGTYL